VTTALNSPQPLGSSLNSVLPLSVESVERIFMTYWVRLVQGPKSALSLSDAGEAHSERHEVSVVFFPSVFSPESHVESIITAVSKSHCLQLSLCRWGIRDHHASDTLRRRTDGPFRSSYYFGWMYGLTQLENFLSSSGRTPKSSQHLCCSNKGMEFSLHSVVLRFVSPSGIVMVVRTTAATYEL
jgi:hypothetical protein